jgi:hypothetical protein
LRAIFIISWWRRFASQKPYNEETQSGEPTDGKINRAVGRKAARKSMDMIVGERKEEVRTKEETKWRGIHGT